MKKLLLLTLSFIIYSYVYSASNDNNVEWNGVEITPGSNVSGATPSSDNYRTLDYSNNQTVFYLRVYKDDISSANVVWRDGIGGSDNYESMTLNHQDATYDYYRVTLTKQNSNLYYVYQINDGTDTDWGGPNGGGSQSVVHDNQPSSYSTDAYNYSDAALPVTLINFSAFLNPQSQAELTWSTASELNASHFNVHHSDNGIEKQAIGVVSAQGNSNEIVEYHFVDAQLLNGQAFYFLEQVDFDGKTEWFGPVKVSNAVNNQADAVFGVNNDIVITLTGSLEMDRLELNLFDMQGQLIKSVEFSGDQLSKTLNFSNIDLPSGMYTLYLQSDRMEQAIKLVK